MNIGDVHDVVMSLITLFTSLNQEIQSYRRGGEGTKKKKKQQQQAHTPLINRRLTRLWSPMIGWLLPAVFHSFSLIHEADNFAGSDGIRLRVRKNGQQKTCNSSCNIAVKRVK